MDERRIQLKTLKKIYKRQRRKALWAWNVLWYLFMALLLVAVGLLLYMIFYKTIVVRVLDVFIWTPIKHLIGIRMNLLFVGVFVLKYAKWFILGFAVAFALVWIMRNRAIKKVKCQDSYLDYMTLKNTLKTERAEEKIQ